MLGVQWDKAVTMNSFVNAQIRTINYHIHAPRQLRPSLKIKVAETIGHAISLSRLEYCNALLGRISAGSAIFANAIFASLTEAGAPIVFPKFCINNLKLRLKKFVSGPKK